MNDHDFVNRIQASRPWPTTPRVTCHRHGGRPVRPSPGQPGTLLQQLDALALFWATPWRHAHPNHAWLLARRLAIPGAR